jgi:hypothetical protein
MTALDSPRHNGHSFSAWSCPDYWICDHSRCPGELCQYSPITCITSPVGHMLASRLFWAYAPGLWTIAAILSRLLPLQICTSNFPSHICGSKTALCVGTEIGSGNWRSYEGIPGWIAEGIVGRILSGYLAGYRKGILCVTDPVTDVVSESCMKRYRDASTTVHVLRRQSPWGSLFQRQSMGLTVMIQNISIFVSHGRKCSWATRRLPDLHYWVPCSHLALES